MLPSDLIRLRHLKTFQEVARQKSISGAANVLAITQPGVSKTIKELETILNAELFDRSHRTLRLTPIGKRFLTHIENSMLALNQGIEEIQEAKERNALPLKIGALPTVSARLLPRAILRYNTKKLGGKPVIVTGSNGYLIRDLREGKVDIVLGRMGEPTEMMGLHFEHLYSEKICFAVRPDHPLLALKTFDMAKIAQYDFIMPSEQSIIRPAVDKLILIANLPRLNIITETVSTAFSRSYVRASDTVWVISEGVVLEDIASGALAALPIDTSSTLGPVGMTLRAEGAISPAVEFFMNEVRRVALSFGR
ncbi:pca operon transcription factor PcaQ [Bartonella sp. HY038]|uniref:pca operon transcription factor PcaQ n=1 Tax=Bartonella sp. HY038 TaxID=2759660 RepID=UPI0015FE7250|nr:pca operon transcription factor PcaQ [Bartonella sp. HY038]